MAPTTIPSHILHILSTLTNLSFLVLPALRLTCGSADHLQLSPSACGCVILRSMWICSCEHLIEELCRTDLATSVSCHFEAICYDNFKHYAAHNATRSAFRYIDPTVYPLGTVQSHWHGQTRALPHVARSLQVVRQQPTFLICF